MDVVEMQIVRIHLSREHIVEAECSGSENPLLPAIEQATGRRWHMTECGSGIEAAPPHREFRLQGAILDLWRLYRASGEISPCIFYIRLETIAIPEYSGVVEAADNSMGS